MVAGFFVLVFGQVYTQDIKIALVDFTPLICR